MINLIDKDKNIFYNFDGIILKKIYKIIFYKIYIQLYIL